MLFWYLRDSMICGELFYICGCHNPSACVAIELSADCAQLFGLLVCWSLTSLCHSNGYIEAMSARKINPFTNLTRIRSQLLRTQ